MEDAPDRVGNFSVGHWCCEWTGQTDGMVATHCSRQSQAQPGPLSPALGHAAPVPAVGSEQLGPGASITMGTTQGRGEGQKLARAGP